MFKTCLINEIYLYIPINNQFITHDEHAFWSFRIFACSCPTTTTKVSSSFFQAAPPAGVKWFPSAAAKNSRSVSTTNLKDRSDNQLFVSKQLIIQYFNNYTVFKYNNLIWWKVLYSTFPMIIDNLSIVENRDLDLQFMKYWMKFYGR